LNRTLKKLVADNLVRQLNDKRYVLTSAGQIWIACATPLLQWVEANPRNAPPPQRSVVGNDPVGGRFMQEAN
jgi:hypothetical protein